MFDVMTNLMKLTFLACLCLICKLYAMTKTLVYWLVCYFRSCIRL